ncbi:unnamed protein product [Miscanthus lutarioriparius]|uniref:Uncharacterized protein n=1 Tax=Miscanthus lutarioriparius TaxID=422564 RepID=A0A811N134_9POAL|nr:unnamed protein product [Miscanthus lutarioriparius]
MAARTAGSRPPHLLPLSLASSEIYGDLMETRMATCLRAPPPRQTHTAPSTLRHHARMAQLGNFLWSSGATALSKYSERDGPTTTSRLPHGSRAEGDRRRRLTRPT